MFALCAISWPTSADNAKPLTTILLVARAELPDPSFKDSIVLVMNHIGPVPGRRHHQQAHADSRLACFSRARTPWRSWTTRCTSAVPSTVQSVSFLFRVDKPPEQPATEVLDGVYFSANRELLRQLLGRDKPDGRPADLRRLLGWARGQLEAEIARGDWALEPANATAIFEPKSQHPWPERQAPGVSCGA